ncbi:MAG: HAMP domain-containing histidine kinase [Cyanobacteria bacterium HKST-UBA02]|nr:HAMP domain-containing histidine kinase [Cyanobacteria bacterium HKST-UBA02]
MVSLSLKQKAYILVCVPLTCELAFIGFSLHLLDQAEKEVSRQSHSREVIACCNDLIADIYASRDIFRSRRKSGFPDPEEVSGIESHTIRGLSRRINNLQRLVKGNKDEYEAACKLLTVSNENVEVLKQLKRNIGGNPSSSRAYMKAASSRLSGSMIAISDSINDIMYKEKNIDKESPAVQARFRGQARNVLLLAVGLNILLAVALAIYFNRGTARRLNILVDNTRRLAEGQPLNQPLGGSDEIALLDRVFKEMAESLQELDRLKKEFMAMVSHDLRSPLSSIHAIATMLDSGKYGEISETGKRRLAQMNISIERVMSLTKNLLDIEMIESGSLILDPVELPVSKLLESCLASTEAYAIQQAVELAVEAPEGITATVDEERIVQVLVNLTGNAIKFSPRNSRVVIAAAHNVDFIEFSVTDSGRGIPEKKRSEIFERFKQVDKTDSTVRKGTGLGLAICKEIVEKHGGEIGVRSEEGMGSTFFFTVPA